MIASVFSTFATALFAIMMAPMSLNAMLDTSPVQTQVGEIIHVAPKGGLDAGYNVFYRPSPLGAEAAKMFVSSARAANLTVPILEAAYIEVKYRSGAFADAYYVSYDTFAVHPGGEAKD